MPIPIETLILFIPMMYIAAISPGPDVLYVISRSVGQDRKAGFMAVLGIATGLVVQTMAVAFGLAELFEHVPMTYTIMKWVGAAYLIYLAIMILRSKSTVDIQQRQNRSYRRIYVQGFLTNLLNPKAVIFFAAVLPQFVDKSLGDIQGQLIWIGITAVIVGFLGHMSIALMAQEISRRVRSEAGSTFLEIQKYILATLFGGLAVKLALSSKP